MSVTELIEEIESLLSIVADESYPSHKNMLIMEALPHLHQLARLRAEVEGLPVHLRTKRAFSHEVVRVIDRAEVLKLLPEAQS